MVMLGFAMDSVQLKAQYKNGERDFRGIVLPGVNLVWVELKGVDLRGADLSHANLSGADLNGSNLSDDTNLAFTDLSRVDLRNTNLKGARLEGANLEGVQLEGAVYDENTRFPRGFDPQLVGGIPGGSLAQKSEHQTSTPLKPELKKLTLQTSTPQKPKPNKKSKPGTNVEKTEEPLQHELDLSISNEDSEQYAPNTQPTELQEDLSTPRSYQFGQPFNLQSVNPGPILSRFYRSIKSSKTSDRLKNSGGRTQLAKDTVTSMNDWHQTQHTDWTLAPAQPSEILSNSSGQGKTSQVPGGIKRWNWGAFLLPWLWFIPNQVWGGILLWLLSLIPQWNMLFAVLFAIAFGLNGNEWAWKARPWDSPEAFRKHQKLWAIAGFLVWGLIIFITLSSKR
jgi:hypothetical protein